MIKITHKALNILLIEDDENDIFLVEKAFLRSMPRRDYHITTIANGKDAICYLETLGTRLPDIILLNLSLPGIPGMSVKEYIEVHPHLKQIPVVIISGASKPSNVATNDFVPKLTSFADFTLRLMGAVNYRLARIG